MSIVITYETLFDLLRKEKSRDELQSLPERFYADVAAFLERKHAEAAGSGAAGQRASIEYENIKKIMRELYERRERKLLLLALNKARTEGALIDQSVLMPQEKALFETLVAELTKSKTDTLAMLGSAAPAIQTAVEQPTPAAPKTTPPPDPATATDAEGDDEKKVEKGAVADGTKVKFLSDVPKFYGPGKQLFGPYKAGDEAALPDKIAQILIRKKRAESL